MYGFPKSVQDYAWDSQEYNLQRRHQEYNVGWKPEGRKPHFLYTRIVSFWFSMEHCLTAWTPFSHSRQICKIKGLTGLTHWALDHIKMWSDTIILDWVLCTKRKSKNILQKMSPHLSQLNIAMAHIRIILGEISCESSNWQHIDKDWRSLF